MAVDEDAIGSTPGNSGGGGGGGFISQSYLKGIKSLRASFLHSMIWGSSF